MERKMREGIRGKGKKEGEEEGRWENLKRRWETRWENEKYSKGLFCSVFFLVCFSFSQIKTFLYLLIINQQKDCRSHCI